MRRDVVISISTGKISILPMIWATFLGTILSSKQVTIMKEDEGSIAGKFILPGTLLLENLGCFGIICVCVFISDRIINWKSGNAVNPLACVPTLLLLAGVSLSGVTAACGADYSFQFSHGYASVFNDLALTEHAEQLIQRHFGQNRSARIDPVMPGEDFSAFSECCPGCFLELGTRNPETGCDIQHHNACYKMDEDALIYGAEFFRTLILDRLGGNA